jgi:glycosyltransferase involved in cell wall biosynthesis
MTKISIVIPLMNESLLVNELVNRVKFNAGSITQDFEIILVDDGSSDSTWLEILAQANSDKRVKGINFSRNFGHHFAITAGLNKAEGDWIVVMDGDLQDRPEVIPDLHQKALEGFDIVYVSRLKRPEGTFYLFVQRIFYLTLNILTGLHFNHRQANFSIISRKVLNTFNTIQENSRFYVSTLKWMGFKEGTVFAEHGKRFAGKPSYTVKKRLRLATEIIISFSERPLRIAILIGILEIIISIMILTFTLFKSNAFLGENITFLVLTSIFFVSGNTKILIGILGVYIGRVFNQVKNRPLYLINNLVNL